MATESFHLVMKVTREFETLDTADVFEREPTAEEVNAWLLGQMDDEDAPEVDRSVSSRQLAVWAQRLLDGSRHLEAMTAPAYRELNAYKDRQTAYANTISEILAALAGG